MEEECGLGHYGIFWMSKQFDGLYFGSIHIKCTPTVFERSAELPLCDLRSSCNFDH